MWKLRPKDFSGMFVLPCFDAFYPWFEEVKRAVSAKDDSNQALKPA